MFNLIITFLASFLIWFMFAGLIILWLINGKITKEQALHALFSALIAWVIAQMIKNIFPTPRPFELDGTIPMTISVPQDGAFPSGHAALVFGLSTSIWLHDKKLGLIFVISAILVAWARVVGNVHYLTDIFGGALLGIVTSYTLEKLHLQKLIK